MPSLSFKGKSFVQNHHLSVPYHELIPDKSKSITDEISLKENLIINGDNLLALKALLPLYRGEIKCIYIDPPYNTGNENWAYNDNVNSPMMQDWLGKVVDKEDMSRHDKWLCMMYPRLKLLKELLKDDGVIFVSIDDAEFSNLKFIMDEIFSSENFVATFVWKRRASSAMADKLVSKDHEYVLCYQKGGFNAFIGTEKDFKSYSNPDNDHRGDWTKGDLTVGMTKEQRPNQYYDLIDPDTGIAYPANPQRVWAYIPESMQKLLDDKRVIFPSSSEGKPMFKRFKSDLKTNVNPISTWITDVNEALKMTDDSEITVLGSGLNSEGTKVVQQLFGEKIFDYPKPPSLLKALIKQVCDKDDIVLDSFAGSGTTGQAVLELNKEDQGNRKFILVEMEDYADKITAERIRKIVRNLELDEKFSYFTLGKALKIETILSGTSLPSYEEMARYLFFTSTGEEFDPNKVKMETNYIGSSKSHDVFMIYKPDLYYLKNTPLNLERAKSIAGGNKRKLVFAPMKYLEQEYLDRYKIDFVQLPYEIYKVKD
ncbi:hypothetical protein Q73_01320 [Bacillus coahuilensis m2-6]|uniref:site-specific DNA-methyltransferase n=1 Tax=Bacillus TaxID=1386 RepID=UPI0007502A74|nr:MULTISPECIES: site-specific DNA-methyltransferase [Bacillus]KAB2425449.1 site-specific DNA-methyltransferase [Bacillus cereus]KUP09734.1 hypothetical protein Q73_01320 [Bacillus coahuilensis m2-6]